jgi:hypothetical protein
VTAISVEALTEDYARVSGDLNGKVRSRRPAESDREQLCPLVSTSIFRFYTFVVVHDLRLTLLAVDRNIETKENEHENTDGTNVA